MQKNLETKHFQKLFYIFIFLIAVSSFASCTSSKDIESPENTEPKIVHWQTEKSDVSKIIETAMNEQGNEMYSPDVDSTVQYWLNNSVIILHGSTKCNIYALNVLYKAGFKTPSANSLSRDLFDTSNYRDIFPVEGINEISNARTGDLIVWNGHVIIFESYITLNDGLYAIGWWAGTRQADNGVNIKNNVCHGKYKLDGEFVIRRPVKRFEY